MVFFQDNAFQKVVCRMSIILASPDVVKKNGGINDRGRDPMFYLLVAGPYKQRHHV